jgi:hypothetical protein
LRKKAANRRKNPQKAANLIFAPFGGNLNIVIGM